MSLIKPSTAAKPPSTSSRSSRFLGCFGFSGDTMQPSTEEEEEGQVNSSGRRRKWVFKWKSSFRKSAAKTVVVPVELTAAGPRKSTKSFTRSPATPTWEVPVVEEIQGRIVVEPRFASTEEDATLTKKPAITATSDEQNSRRKKWIDIVKRQNGSSNRSRRSRKETKPAAVAPPAPGLRSPEKKSVTTSDDVVPVVVPPTRPLTRSKSISPPPQPAAAKGKKLPRDPPAGGGVGDGGSNRTAAFGGGFDSIIGMSIILVTLVIMMLWGKICAILCTSAWFFIAPRLVAAGGHSAVATAEKRVVESHNKVDLESVEYKKKVVLEGLLQRNHRNVVVVGRL